MTVKELVSDVIVYGRQKFKKDPRTTQVRFEGGNFVQYSCNPTPEQGMKSVSSDVTDFVSYVEKVNGEDYSYVVRAIGGKIPATYHCLACNFGHS